MRAGPVTQPLKLAQCQKCSGYVFSALAAGLDTSVDPAPVRGAEAARNALLAGKSLYTARLVAGKPHTLEYVMPNRLAVLIGREEPLYVTHGCMAAGVVRASVVERAPVDPQQAPVTLGGHQGGFRPAPAPASGSQGHTAKITKGASSEPSPRVARPVNRPRSDPKPTRCILCRKLITGKEPNIVAIEYDGRLVYAYHVDD